ncbi:MAG: ATP-grasp domain-containing protein [Myxococcota bacterium]
MLGPTVDAELEALAKHRRRFVDAGVRLVLADDEPLARCLDKYRLAEWCREHTCVPETRVFVSHMSASGMTFPLVVKPRRGSGSRGVRIVESPGALARLTPSKDLLLQEYLPGPEYSVDVLLTPFGEVLATVPRERLKVDSGVAVASRTLHSEELQSAARCVVQVLRLSHVVNVQFRRNTRGEMALLEVNARVPGTMPLTVEAGVNMPAFAILQVLGRPLPSKVADFRELGVVRHLVERFVDVDALLPLSERETLPPGVTHGAAE